MDILWNPTEANELIAKAAGVIDVVANGNFHRDNIRTETFTTGIVAEVRKHAAWFYFAFYDDRGVGKSQRQDINRQVVRAVERITGSAPVPGESLLGSKDLRRQLREAKAGLRSGKKPVRK